MVQPTGTVAKNNQEHVGLIFVNWLLSKVYFPQFMGPGRFLWGSGQTGLVGEGVLAADCCGALPRSRDEEYGGFL